VFLLLDDNHINLKILTSYMKKLGRPYVTATNGQEAVDAYRRQSPTARCKCVFMDISMPVMDGFEATRRIRAHESEQHLEPAVIFALSGLASTDAQHEAFRSGIDLFLAKPVKLREISSILRSRRLL
jgi:CheY-like chemotaxis protein